MTREKKTTGSFVTRAECQRCKTKTLAILADIQEGQSRMMMLLQRLLDERTGCPMEKR